MEQLWEENISEFTFSLKFEKTFKGEHKEVYLMAH